MNVTFSKVHPKQEEKCSSSTFFHCHVDLGVGSSSSRLLIHAYPKIGPNFSLSYTSHFQHLLLSAFKVLHTS